MSRANVAVVIGTRPEAIKLAPVCAALRDSERLQPVVISTGQHREMLDQALAVFGISADIDLAIMSHDQTLHDVTARAVTRMRDALAEIAPAWVVVQGDTTTALGAAMAAFYDRLPVAHVEAGLRSGQRYAPFPEEINRRMIDQIAELLLAPTRLAGARLLAEGADPTSVHVTGNTVVDALLAIRRRLEKQPIDIPGLPESAIDGRRVVLVTAHRRESFGQGFVDMCRALQQIIRDNPDVVVVYPVHLNPNVSGPVRELLALDDRVVLLPPLDYLEFVALMERAHLVLTDSGGVQEEAPSLGKPLLVLREVTERPEGVDAGVARLVGTSAARISEAATTLLCDAEAYRAMVTAENPYGDGAASSRIVALLEREVA